MPTARRARQGRDNVRTQVFVEVGASERATDTVAGALELRLERLLTPREQLLHAGLSSKAFEAEIDSLLDQLEIALRCHEADDRTLA